MPRIPDRNLRSIVIIFVNHKPAGTAFLIEFSKEHGVRHIYLVTCQHCIADSVVARLSDGSQITLHRSDWILSPVSEDVAAADVTDYVSDALKGEEFIPYGSIILRDETELRDYGIGDEIYMLGLHVDESDTGKNSPRARFGYLSGWNVPLKQGNEKTHPSHLGDMRSRMGFSGSPVFVFRTTEALGGYQTVKFKLLGVHSGQFKDNVEVTTHSTQQWMRIPSSMTIIVASWALTFIEDSPTFAERRRSRVALELNRGVC